MFGGRERPFVLINGAVSADGKLALENRSLIQFSSQRDRFFVFQLRARVDAVLCGMETVESFSIDLSVGPPACRAARKQRKLKPEPIRVLVSPDGDLDPSARVFQNTSAPIVVLTTQRGAKRCLKTLTQPVRVQAFGKSAVDFVAAFRWLRDEFAVKRLLCEGGGETNAALIRSGVVDQIHLTVCPLVLCGRRAPTLCDGTGFAALDQSTRLKLKSVKALNGELFLVYRVLPQNPGRGSPD